MEEKKKPSIHITQGKQNCKYCKHPLFASLELKNEYHTECHTLMELYKPKEIKAPKIVVDFLNEFSKLNFEKFKEYLEPQIYYYGRGQEYVEEILSKLTPDMYKKYFTIDDFTFNDKQEVVAIDFANAEYVPEDHIRHEDMFKLLFQQVSETRPVFVIPDSISQFEKLIKLNLNGHLFTELPEGIMGCKNLKHLYLDGRMHDKKNRFTNRNRTFECDAFSDAYKLEKLEFLSMRYLGITELPEGFSKLESLKYLNISENRLKELPKSFGNLEDLTWLNLSKNSIEHLPESFEILSNLKYLNLRSNKLQQLSEPLFYLKKLQTLNLGFNKIIRWNESKLPVVFEKLEKLDLSCNTLQKFPEKIPVMPSLKILNLSTNYITNLPENIGSLQSLEELEINENRLITLPDSIGKLKRLVMLSLRTNRIKILPECIGDLHSLKTLSLSENTLTELTSSISNLKQLTVLFLGKNQLECLPENFGNLLSLKSLDIDSNPIQSFPASINQLVNLSFLEVRNTSQELIKSVHNLFQQELTIIDNQEAYHREFGSP